MTTTYTGTTYDLLAVDSLGTAYGVQLGSDESQIWASSDGRVFTPKGTAAGNFWTMTSLQDGTLLADTSQGSGHVVVRSTDHGASWSNVLNTGVYRTLTPHSFAELDGAVYYIQYQTFTTQSTPIQLWKSNDRGATWFLQFTFQGHRHAHGMMPDPSRRALFAFFGDFDDQSGLYRSTDGGASWKLIKGGTQAGDIVDGTVLADGSFLCGQDISYHGSIPDTPQIARIALDGTETDYVQLPAASYSTHAVGSGGFVVGSTYEMDNDISLGQRRWRPLGPALDRAARVVQRRRPNRRLLGAAHRRAGDERPQRAGLRPGRPRLSAAETKQTLNPGTQYRFSSDVELAVRKTPSDLRRKSVLCPRIRLH